jgi:hypothetical protein
MRFMEANVWAVWVSALATMVVGFVWCSPLLFARRWTLLRGCDPDDKAKLAEMQKSAGPSYRRSLVARVLSAAALGKIIAIAIIHTPPYGIKMGLAVWQGFLTTVQLTNALFMRPPSCTPSTPLSTGVLRGDGSDHGGLAVAIRVSLLDDQSADKIGQACNIPVVAPTLQVIDDLLRSARIPIAGGADLDGGGSGEHEFRDIGSV